jgi:hypothetical protein
MSGGSSANSFSGGLRTIDGSVAGVFSIDPRRNRLTRRSGTGAAMTVAIYVFAAIGMVVTTVIVTAIIVDLTVRAVTTIREWKNPTSGPNGRDCWNA